MERESAGYDPAMPENIADRHQAESINRLIDDDLLTPSEASHFSNRGEFEKPEAVEAAFDVEARHHMKMFLEETRADDSPGFEEYKDKAAECLKSIQELSRERNGEDHTLWLNFQMALAYDHFSDTIEEFHSYYLKRLDILTDLINDFPDDITAGYWAYKLKEYFPDQIRLVANYKLPGNNKG